MRRLWLPVSYIGMAFRTRSDSLILGQAAPPATSALEGGAWSSPWTTGPSWQRPSGSPTDSGSRWWVRDWRPRLSGSSWSGGRRRVAGVPLVEAGADATVEPKRRRLGLLRKW